MFIFISLLLSESRKARGKVFSVRKLVPINNQAGVANRRLYYDSLC